MNIKIISIGDELLLGQTVNTNASWMGQQLADIGIQVGEVVTIADDFDAIVNTVKASFRDYEVTLITGGLGPTKDDITKVALASAFDKEMALHQETYDRLVEKFARYGLPVKESHEKQCRLPLDFNIYQNEVGTAPAMHYQEEGHHLVSMPGVPHEMKFLLSTYILPLIQKEVGGQAFLRKTVRTACVGESILESKLEPVLANLKDDFKVAFLPANGQVRLRFEVPDDAKSRQSFETDCRALTDVIKEHIYAYEDIDIALAVGKILKDLGQTLGVAESCTGGLLSYLITKHPGSSAYYLGGVVAYANSMKMDFIRVQESTLIAHGAVSEETATEMVKGIIAETGSDYGIAITGVAGPGGGSPQKPVGTVIVAVGSKDEVIIDKITNDRGRTRNMAYACTRSLFLLLQMIKG